jgi:hypothetical protein
LKNIVGVFLLEVELLDSKIIEISCSEKLIIVQNMSRISPCINNSPLDKKLQTFGSVIFTICFHFIGLRSLLGSTCQSET